MKRNATLGISVIVLICLGCAAGAKPITLIYKFKVGDVDTYKMSVTMNMRSDTLDVGTSPVVVKDVMRQRVLKVLPDGSARIRQYDSDIKFSAPDPVTKATPNSKTTTIWTIPGEAGDSTVFVTVSKTGKLLKMEGLEKKDSFWPNPSIVIQMTQAIFPARPVNVGESWTQNIPFPTGDGDLTVVSKLVSVSEPVGDKTAARIAQTFKSHTVEGSATGSSTPKDGDLSGEMSAAVDVTGSSDVVFSPTLGKMLKFKFNETWTLTTSAPDGENSDSMDATVEMERVN